MFSTQKQKENYINKLFNNIELFEWDVLHISSNTDRAEVMEIIAENLVFKSLKNEINFLYITNVEKINFKKIKSAIFSEIINEWLNFCDDVLMYPKKDALLVVKQGERIKFIYSLVNSYYEKFQRIIFSKMFDSFLKYFEKSQISNNQQIFIEKVLQSNLNEEKNFFTIHKFIQLQTRVKIAKNKKNKEIEKINKKIKELMEKLNDNQEDDDEIVLKIEDYDYEVNELEKKGLHEFDEIIAKLRNNMIDGMKKASLKR